jgi:hypothetical protein
MRYGYGRGGRIATKQAIKSFITNKQKQAHHHGVPALFMVDCSTI